MKLPNFSSRERKLLVYWSVIALSMILAACVKVTASLDSRYIVDSNRKTFPVSVVDLRHGEMQLVHLLQDRPRMKGFVRRGDPVWSWTIRQFAGEGLGTRIYWNGQDPELPQQYLAQSVYPNEFNPKGCIRLREEDENRRPLSGEQMWALVLFELHNIRNANLLAKINSAARLGELSKDEFISYNTRLEYSAACELKSFYTGHWLPNLEKLHLQSEDSYWYMTKLPETYEKWIMRFKNKSGYPYDCFGDFYEKEIAPLHVTGRRH